jgi:hypothetical protein
MFRVVIDDPVALEKAKSSDGLRDLCRREVARFHEYLQNFGGDYKDGLSKWEGLAIEGYLYQKFRGHIDEKVPQLTP